MLLTLQECLPAQLRGADTTITPVAAGLSGAGVYRVDSNGTVFVLKVSAQNEPAADWRRKLSVQQRAADAGLAPRIIHSDETCRAILSEFVVDRSFPALFANPDTRETALVELGQTIRRVHDLPADGDAKSPRDALAATWSALDPGFPLPSFVADAVRHVLGEPPTASGRVPVLSHNDVNPSNIVYDGEKLLLVDWDTAGVNDPYYDLAAISVFLRMDGATCQRLLSAYDGQLVAEVPTGFAYNRRLVGALCGVTFMRLARQNGHAGATGGETLESTPSLLDVYQKMRAGLMSLATADGQWMFGLALINESAHIRSS
ncbi:MAG: hypothetical protein JWM95_4810 [Gemmatimonadetes bacterium]|nr:hypothetical protein [Gemmatimonadota bacterium]